MQAVKIIHNAFHEPSTRIYTIVQTAIWGLILISVAMLFVEPLLPETAAAGGPFRVAEYIVLGIFVVEYVLRVASFSPPALEVFQPNALTSLRTHVLARVRFALRPMMLVDLLAVLTVFPELRALRVVRLLRLLRSVKLFQYTNPFASIMQAFEENSLLFVFGFIVLFTEMIFGGVSMYFIERASNPAINTVFDGLWWSLVTITTVGFGDIAPVTTLGRIVAGFLMIGGMLTIALFAGFVGSSLVNAMLSIREEQFRMGEHVNHIVVLGYDKSSEYLLSIFEELFETEDLRVVVFEDQERPRELSPNVLWVQGDPTKQSELDKVRLTHAKAAIVVGLRNISPQAADARAILTTFTIRSYLQKKAEMTSNRLTPLYVVTEILDVENVDHARAAGADEVVETRRLGFSMIAHTARYHHTADSMSRLLLSGSYNPYVGKIPHGIDQATPYAELLAQLQLTSQGALVIGLYPPGEPALINPARDYPVTPGTHLIYLAEEPVLEPPA